MCHLVLNGSTSVSLAASQTLTIRLHWACSSTGTPRHVLLKNVVVKGMAQVVTATATSPALAAAQLYPNLTPDGRLTLALPTRREAMQLSIHNSLGPHFMNGPQPTHN